MVFALKFSRSTPKVQSTIKPQAGFSVVELIVAMAVFLLVVPGLVVVLWQSQTVPPELNHQRQALAAAETTLDGLRQQSANNFNSIKNSTTYVPPYQTAVTVNYLNP